MDSRLRSLFRSNEQLATLVHHGVISLMLLCVVISIVQVGSRLLPGWNGIYLLALGWLATLEAMLSWRYTRRLGLFSQEWLLYRLAEWVVIAVVVKLCLYLVRGFGQLWADLLAWQTSFWENFFTGEYLFALLVILLIWMLAGMFAEQLFNLEGDENLLRMERESGIASERPQTRRQLASSIFTVGLGLVFLATLLRREGGGSEPATLWNVFAYFLLALLLLSLTQFAILRVEWSLDRTPIARNLTSRWLAYSFLFLLILTLIASVLPTRYSLGLLQVLNILLAGLSALIWLLAILVLTPLFFLYGLLLRLLGRPAPEQQPLPPPQQFLPPPPAAPQDWNALLKSLVFWVLFLGVITFSLVYYLRQHGELRDRLRQAGLFSPLRRIWAWLAGWLRGLNQNLVAAAAAGRQRLQASWAARRASRTVAPLRFTNPRRLSPRQRVQFFYLTFLRRSAQRGLPRRPGQTPYEYAGDLRRNLLEADPDLAQLTDEFLEARYTRHPVEEQQAHRARQYWERLRQALKKWRVK